MRLIKKSIPMILVCIFILTQTALFASAAPETKEWLEPYDNSAFPLAKQVNMKYPPDYDAKPTKDKVFSANSDKKALAAFSTNAHMRLFKKHFGDKYKRTASLMKDYVGVDLEIIYEFKNGLKDFEFCGLAGAGMWAGAFGMEGTIEFATSDKIDAGWTTHIYTPIEKIVGDAANYKDIRDIAGSDATKAYFRSSKIPTSVRYLRVKFPSALNAEKEPIFENWACVLGYLKVNEYTSAQTGNGETSQPGGPTTSKPGGNTQKPGESSVTPPKGDNDTSQTNSQTGSEEILGSGESQITSGTNLKDGEEIVTEVSEVNWGLTIGLIIGGVVALAGIGALVFFLIKKNKDNQE